MGSGGGGGGGGGGGRMVVAIVVVMSAVVSPAVGQTVDGDGGDGVGGGIFQLYKSCGASINVSNLAVERTMWLRGAGEEVTLTTLRNSSEPCVLPPNASHQVTVGIHLQVHVGSAAGEEEEEDEEDKDVCNFVRHAVFVLPKGVLMVSCLADKTKAEAEMLGAEGSSSNAPPRPKPQGRALDPPSTADKPDHTPTTTPPSSSQAPPAAATRFEPFSTGTRVEGLDTTLTAIGAHFSTEAPPLTDDRGMWTTLGQDTTLKEGTTRWQEMTEMPTSTPEYVIESRTAEATDGNTKSPSPGSSSSSSTQNTGQAGKIPPLLRTRPPLIRNENISVRELTAQSGGQVSEEQVSGDHDDHVIYFAGAGAGVGVLVLGVVVVVCVAYYRSRKVKKMNPTDMFMSGGYQDSLNSLSGSHGAYLNAHVMYSGADPEFAESFELEERIMNSNISYSAHDIPKCLKGP